ncbi:hypothetical protein A3K63_04180 [Candidatus Micrarchaeota archaeon RBG_16_49_10]|nr:MAG: hypothetical protein A3K63_04180 [Candidatus Micrarchaeota archaeon RBG_16_49_10]
MLRPDGIEKKLLELLSDSLVLRRSEIVQMLKSRRMDASGIDVVTKSLLARGFITEVYASEKTFAITQRGMKGER